MGATLVKVQDGETILAGQRLAPGVSTVGLYQKRLSGPLLDRSAKPPGGIDIHVEVPQVDYEKLSDGEAS